MTVCLSSTGPCLSWLCRGSAAAFVDAWRAPSRQRANLTRARCPGSHLWPHDFPAQREDRRQDALCSFWSPELVVMGAGHFGALGLEKQSWRDGVRWFAQRWICEPATHAEILAELACPEHSTPQARAAPEPDVGGGATPRSPTRFSADDELQRLRGRRTACSIFKCARN